jgi:hypothetical protein
MMDTAFQFEDGGRTYTCRVGEAQTAPSARTARTAPWWWFGVSGDGHRYAPFHADAGDTQESVRPRIVAYYEALLVRRAAPRAPWMRRGQGVTVAPAQPAQ